MTLFLSFACPLFALQVCDRRVTTGGAIYDSQANKTIVYSSHDALLSISYTGIAYIDGLTTDEWIAQALAGQTYRRSGEPFLPSMVADPLLSNTSGRAALSRLVCAMRGSFTALPATESRPRFEVGIVGWVRRGDAWLQYVLIVMKRKEARNLAFKGGWRTPLALSHTWWMSGGWEHTLGSLHKELRDSLANPPGSATDATYLKAEFVRDKFGRAILAAARQYREIGPDALSVLMPKPHRGVQLHPAQAGIGMPGSFAWPGEDAYTLVRYHGSAPNFQDPFPGTFVGTIETGFSPWVVGERTRAAPSLIIGQQAILAHPHRILLQGPTPDDGLVFLSVGQDRTAPPQR